MRRQMNLDAAVYLEQTAPGRFIRHSLESVTCDHATCVAGAWDGDGRTHLAVGNACLFDQDRVANSVTIWKNLGPVKRGQGKAD